MLVNNVRLLLVRRCSCPIHNVHRKPDGDHVDDVDDNCDDHEDDAGEDNSDQAINNDDGDGILLRLRRALQTR